MSRITIGAALTTLSLVGETKEKGGGKRSGNEAVCYVSILVFIFRKRKPLLFPLRSLNSSLFSFPLFLFSHLSLSLSLSSLPLPSLATEHTALTSRKWEEFMATVDFRLAETLNSPTLKTLIRGGVPIQFRREIWLYYVMECVGKRGVKEIGERMEG